MKRARKISANAKAPDLSEMVREVLKEQPSEREAGATPLYQPRTVPLIVPTSGVRPASAGPPTPRPAAGEPALVLKPAAQPAKVVAPGARKIGEGLDDEDARPVSATMKTVKRSSRSTYAVAMMGFVALLAGGAAAYAHQKGALAAKPEAPPAVAMAAAPAPATPESVKFVVPARANEAPPAAPIDPPVTMPVAAAPRTPVAEAPTPVAATPVAVREREPREPKATRTAMEPKPASESSRARSEESKPRAETKPKASEKQADAPAPKPAAPTPPSVDAILQQQLNSALP